jgi:hypothetical protein
MWEGWICPRGRGRGPRLSCGQRGGGAKPAGSAPGGGRPRARQASQGSRGAATPRCCQRRPGSDQVPYTLAGTGFWPEQPERRGHLGLTDSVGAPGAGSRLNYDWHMAIVVLLLFVLTGLLLVAADDLADGDGCERAAPRAVGGVVPSRRASSARPRCTRGHRGSRAPPPARLEIRMASLEAHALAELM